MPRIPYLSEVDVSITPQLLNAICQRRPNQTLLNLDKVLLHSEPLITSWQDFFTTLRNKLHFSGKLRELAILRVAVVNRAPYEFAQHTNEALKEGITQEQIDAISSWQDGKLFNKQEQAVLAYTDAMTLEVQVPEPIFQALHAWFTQQEIVELTALIAGYNMVSRFLEALQITVEGES